MNCAGLILAVLLAATGAMADDMDSLFARLKENYASDRSHESAMALLESVRPDGTWSGPEYRKKGHTPIEHLKNVRALAEDFDHSCAGKVQGGRCENLKAAVAKSLRFWLDHEKDFVSDNWWMNEIGIQRELAPIAFLMWDVLSPDLRSKTVLPFPEAPGGNGVNRTWISELVAIRGVLEGREPLVRLGLSNIEATMAVTDMEGPQVDHSYFMHGNQLYNGAYGKMALSIAAKWALICRGTALAFGRETLVAMTDLALEGNRWMMWRGMVDAMTLGREISRKDGNALSENFLSVIDNLSRVDSLNAAAYASWKRNIAEGTGDSLEGCRYFWRGELMVCRAVDYYVSLKMSSVNTVGSESINRENRRGLWLGTGVLSAYRHGDDYRNVYPLWDWSKLPGTTAGPEYEQKEKRVTNMSGLVGGLSDGSFGVAAMELKRPGLSGKKSWFFMDGKVVALGADIDGDLGDEVTTAIDQRMLISENNLVLKNQDKIKHDSVYATDALWYDGVGYRSLDGKPFLVRVQEKTGNWKDIGTLKQQENGNILLLWRSHGFNPRNESYAYLLDMRADRESFAHGMDKSGVGILENSASAQLVRHARKSLWAGAVYEPRKITSDSLQIAFSAPCVFVLEQEARKAKLKIAALDRNESELKVSVEKIAKGKVVPVYSAVLPLPQKEFAGKSIQVEMEL